MIDTLALDFDLSSGTHCTFTEIYFTYVYALRIFFWNEERSRKKKTRG